MRYKGAFIRIIRLACYQLNASFDHCISRLAILYDSEYIYLWHCTCGCVIESSGNPAITTVHD